MTRSVVVGLDASAGALAAAHFAAEIAERRHATLTLVHVCTTFFPRYERFSPGRYPVAEQRLRESAEELLAQTVAAVETAHPGVKVDSRLEDGRTAARLIEESADALMTVVGSRGTGGFAGLMLGSVPAQVAALGYGPVIVMRAAAAPNGPVLVGFDGSAGARWALQFGIQEALARGVPVVVANAYGDQPLGPYRQPDADQVLAAREQAEQMINIALELPVAEHPGLRYDIRLVHALDPERSLIEESAGASLTVVGSRGRGGFAGLLLGSVSRNLIHHAIGPVAVVHPGKY